MKIIILLAALIFFSGCTKEQRKTKTTETKKDNQINTPQTTGSTNTPQGAHDENSNGQSVLSNIEYGISNLPPNLKDYDGKIVSMAKWEDRLGANILFITETTERSSGGENRHKELYGYHYTVTDKENKLIWKINDFVKDCPVDITLKYIDESLSITDLDNDGIGESTFLYRISCKGDVSPDGMKLLMHEGETKYAIRGEMRLEIAGEGSYGGEMKMDKSFNDAPKEFLDYAKSRWNKFKDERVG